MAEHTELRVHGVSGTPPRDMLYTDPVTTDPPDDHTRVYSPRPPDRTSTDDGREHEFTASAFHWGSLTTGHWLTAFWILLGPFAFANVAGWMVSRNTRTSHASIRLAGVALTALFVAQLGFLFLEVPISLSREGSARGWLILSAIVYALLFVVGAVVSLSTQSHFTDLRLRKRIELTLWPSTRFMLPPSLQDHPEVAARAGQWDDPAGASLSDPAVWELHAMLHRIRRLHLTAGLGVMTTLIGLGLSTPWIAWSGVTLSAAAAVLVVSTTYWPTSGAVLTLTAWSPLVSSMGFALAIWQLAVADLPVGDWANIHNATFAIALVLGFAGVATLAAGMVTLGAVTMGTLYGASLGVGIGLIVERAFGIDELSDNGAGWVAVAMFFLVVTLLVVGAVTTFASGPMPEHGKPSALLRRITSRGRLLFVSAAIYGLAAGVLAFVLGCVEGSCRPELLVPPGRGSALFWAAIATTSALVALVAIRLWSVSRWSALSIAALGGAAVWLFATGRMPVLESLALDLNQLVDVSEVLIVIVPSLLILRSILGAVRRGRSNRKVGILWDVASFWPRWFHPLAPPAYGPKVISDLTEERGARAPELLEAHSQGSVIAVVSLNQTDEVGLPGLLTYGSPLGTLYSQLFPESGVADLIRTVEIRLGGRWRNLWRPSDPIGGSPIGLADGDIQVGDGTGHFRYEVTQEFRRARHELIHRESYHSPDQPS